LCKVTQSPSLFNEKLTLGSDNLFNEKKLDPGVRLSFSDRKYVEVYQKILKNKRKE
jgi:hypothetical protein